MLHFKIAGKVHINNQQYTCKDYLLSKKDGAYVIPQNGMNGNVWRGIIQYLSKHYSKRVNYS